MSAELETDASMPEDSFTHVISDRKITIGVLDDAKDPTPPSGD
jgi:hypothetical protein